MAISKSNELANVGKYPSSRLNERERKVLETAESFSPSSPSDWETAPSTQDEALDALAAAGSANMAVATVEWDFSVDGGAVSDIPLGVTLPDNAVIVEVIRDEVTAATSGTSSGTIILSTPTDGALEQTALTANGGSPSVASSGGSAVPKKLTGARQLQVTIAVEAITAGKIKYFVRYMKSI